MTGHVTSEFEIKNSEGETIPFSGFSSNVIGETTSIPDVADKIIEKIYVQNDATIDDRFTELLINHDSEIEVSIDAGVHWKKIFAGRGFTFDTRETKQILIRSNVQGCPFSGIVTFEKFDEVK